VLWRDHAQEVGPLHAATNHHNAPAFAGKTNQSEEVNRIPVAGRSAVIDTSATNPTDNVTMAAIVLGIQAGISNVVTMRCEEETIGKRTTEMKATNHADVAENGDDYEAASAVLTLRHQLMPKSRQNLALLLRL